MRLASLTIGFIGVALIYAACGGSDPTPKPAVASASSSAPPPQPPPPPPPTIADYRASAQKAADAKQWAQVKSDIHSAIALYGASPPPDAETDYKLLAQACHEASPPDTQCELDAAVKIASLDDGKDAYMVLNIVRVLMTNDRQEGALSLLQRATSALAPDAPVENVQAIWRALHYVQIKVGDFEAAAASAKKLTTMYPDEPVFWELLALSEAMGGKLDDAKKDAKTGVDVWVKANDPKKPTNATGEKGPDVLAKLARAYRRAGDPKDAQAALDKFKPAKNETMPAVVTLEAAFVKIANKDYAGAGKLADTLAKTSDKFKGAIALVQGFSLASKKKVDDAKASLATFDASEDAKHFGFERKLLDDMIVAATPAPKPIPAPTPAPSNSAKPK